MANWQKLVSLDANDDLVVDGNMQADKIKLGIGAAGAELILGQNNTAGGSEAYIRCLADNAFGATGRHLHLEAGSGGLQDGSIRIGLDNTRKVVVCDSFEYEGTPSITSGKQIVSLDFLDQYVEQLGVLSISNAIPTQDDLLINSFDANKHQKMTVENFWDAYTDATQSGGNAVQTMVVDSSGFLTSPSMFTVGRNGNRTYLYLLNAYYGVDGGGGGVYASSITSTSDTSVYGWTAHRGGLMIPVKSRIRHMVATLEANGTDEEYRFDVFRVEGPGAQDLEGNNTSMALTCEHLFGYPIDPADSTDMAFIYEDDINIDFEKGDYLLPLLKRTSGTTGTDGRYYYMSWSAAFEYNPY